MSRDHGVYLMRKITLPAYNPYNFQQLLNGPAFFLSSLYDSIRVIIFCGKVFFINNENP